MYDQFSCCFDLILAFLVIFLHHSWMLKETADGNLQLNINTSTKYIKWFLTKNNLKSMEINSASSPIRTKHLKININFWIKFHEPKNQCVILDYIKYKQPCCHDIKTVLLHLHYCANTDPLMINIPPVLNIRPSWLFLERLSLRNRLLYHDIFDIFLDYLLAYR